MQRKVSLHRIFAKHRAARYAGKTRYPGKEDRRRRRYALAMLFVGFVFLYVRELPLVEFPRAGYLMLKKAAERKNETVGEEEVLLIQYAGVPGTYLQVSHVDGNVPDFIPSKVEAEPVSVREILEERFGALEDVSFQSFLSNYYIEDSSTKATEELLKPEKLANYNLGMIKTKEPQILIFHTHGSEGYVDSRTGVTEDTVIGVGELLATELRETYGYNVIHETTVFDRKADGTDDRNNAYNNALPVITKILGEHPSIEVVIDLHRDSGEARTSIINGVSTAKVMLFNGLCRTKDGPVTYYSNPNLEGNLAFSLHLQITGNELYPGLMHRNYLKSYRYNMHLKEKYLLVELGTHKNTVAEARAAMVPFAETIAMVLSGEY